jgi:hypothetical protein
VAQQHWSHRSYDDRMQSRTLGRLVGDTVNRVQHDTQREVAATLAALLRSLGFEKVTVVFEPSSAT